MVRTIGRRVKESLKRVYFDPKRVGSYGGVIALRRVTGAPLKAVKQWLSEQDAYTLQQTGEDPIQEMTCHRGWTQPPVTGRYRRLVENEKRQRRIRVSIDGDRRLFKTGLGRSSEKQVGVVSGDGFEKIVGQHRAYNLGNRQRFKVPQSIRETFVEGALRTSFLRRPRRVSSKG